MPSLPDFLTSQRNKVLERDPAKTLLRPQCVADVSGVPKNAFDQRGPRLDATTSNALLCWPKRRCRRRAPCSPLSPTPARLLRHCTLKFIGNWKQSNMTWRTIFKWLTQKKMKSFRQTCTSSFHLTGKRGEFPNEMIEREKELTINSPLWQSWDIFSSLHTSDNLSLFLCFSYGFLQQYDLTCPYRLQKWRQKKSWLVMRRHWCHFIALHSLFEKSLIITLKNTQKKTNRSAKRCIWRCHF